MAEGPEPRQEDATLLSVTAHGMLGSVSVAKATIATLRLHWGKIDDETCIRLLGRAEDQLAFLGDSLSDLVRGIPTETRAFLDALTDDRD